MTRQSLPVWRMVISAACIAPLVLVLGISTVLISGSPSGLEVEASRRLPSTGVTNPVTAVLLNYRSFDTLLEIAVLLVALLGARAIVGSRKPARLPEIAFEDSVLRGFIRVFAPVLVLVAGYILWIGGKAPGGAFQAGAILASLGGLFWLADFAILDRYSMRTERICLVLGLAVFLLVGVAVMFMDRDFLQYPESMAKNLILIIEVACTISIAATLFALFRAGLTSRDAGDES
jgi:multisubunit Na+/H+ antiporter MnhB subunit